MKTNNSVEPIVVTDIIAKSIEAIAKAMKALSGTRLNRRAIVALLADRSKVSKKTIELILDNLDNLERDWLKPKAA